MTVSLTPRQAECLEFIRERIGSGGIAPSFDEIADRLHLKSKSGVSRIMDVLIERGVIRRLKGRARAIEIVGSAAPGFLVDPVPEVRRAIELYALRHRITAKTAAEEALRAYFVEAAAG